MTTPSPSTLKLHAHVSGNGQPMVFLHGLFGSWQNLGTAVRAAADHAQVHALDLRNHGQSPHHPEHNYPALAGDVAAYIDTQIGEKVILLGHSMGGKTAMQLALTRPDLIRRLLVVDIAPRNYPPNHEEIIAGLEALQGQDINNRKEADNALAEWVPELAIRSFLLKNLILDEGKARWRVNLDVIVSQYSHIADWPEQDRSFAGPVLFLKGAESNYIQEQDREAVLSYFPQAKLKTMASTGHWPHAEKPNVFNKLMLDFIR